ncbi:hypothetical protein AT15_00965 [Kosmotoga arenicorallina S304]|jgi:rubrerythrin|uniref:Rubrerythrin diiron-binding domain-containing protein n=1 Tax=Kosmotoga arenicorallina S304 TaxID=1453497 RepID=A0A176K0I7_9BACT|nr:ferritin family protein [Kosmotoga arenicorallina]OAA30117.1 hypothetical protein AT15_00965 [Kosmotoga arenicorallina S304]
MFSAHEILDIALNIENEGIKFYRELAEKAKDESAKSTFEFLVSQEKEHIITFRELLKRFEKEAQELVNWDEATEYLKTLSEQKVFPSASTLIEKFKNSTPEEVVKYSIEREKDTVIFYYDLLDMIADNEAKEAVKKIIKEEKKHVVILRDLLK